MDGVLKDRIRSILETAKTQIQEEMLGQDINASGRTSASFHVEDYDKGLRLVGGGRNTAPIETLELGRPGGDVPGGFVMTKSGELDVSKTFKAILMRWAYDKGVDLTWGGATMLGRRIAREGTRRHKEHAIVYSYIVNDTVDTLKENISATIKEQIQTNF